MRTLVIGAALLTALLYPAAQASAQCCGGQATSSDQAAHAGHAMPGGQTMAMACCGGHEMAAPAAPTAQAAMPCCQGHDMAAAPAQGAMPCCGAQGMAAAMAPEAMPADDPDVARAGFGLSDPRHVKMMAVAFREPVRVEGTLLLGRYVIEHDDARMARGEPCTYIYAADDFTTPVVTFACTHLSRPDATTATVVIAPTNDQVIKTLKEFQFSGETAAHGVPSVR